MSTITLPNIRVSSDLTVSVRLKDNGVAIDWSTLNNVKASIYSDAQRALAGRCDVSVDAEDPTVLVCQYAANKPQYVGVCRIVVSAKYMGETKTYDKPAFNFVRWTADQDGEQITIDDPDVDVEIEVSDVSSSLLDEAIRAAFTAAEEAVDAKGQVLETEAEVEAAEALRVSAEESRVEAEEGRAEAEAARVDEEAVRVSAEDARVVAENARAAAEDLREGAEDDRAAAETARETAEAARVAAEALRVTAEGSRETAEAAREAQASADHTTAASDHTQAAADHTQAASDHTTAASDHTQAGADHTLAAADHVTAGEDHAQAQDDHEVMAGYDTRLGNVEGEVSQLEAKVNGKQGYDVDLDVAVTAGSGISRNTHHAFDNILKAGHTYTISATGLGNVSSISIYFYQSDNSSGATGYWDEETTATITKSFTTKVPSRTFTPGSDVYYWAIYLQAAAATTTGTVTFNIHEDAIVGLSEQITTVQGETTALAKKVDNTLKQTVTLASSNVTSQKVTGTFPIGTVVMLKVEMVGTAAITQARLYDQSGYTNLRVTVTNGEWVYVTLTRAATELYFYIASGYISTTGSAVLYISVPSVVYDTQKNADGILQLDRAVSNDVSGTIALTAGTNSPSTAMRLVRGDFKEGDIVTVNVSTADATVAEVSVYSMPQTLAGSIPASKFGTDVDIALTADGSYIGLFAAAADITVGGTLSYTIKAPSLDKRIRENAARIDNVEQLAETPDPVDRVAMKTENPLDKISRNVGFAAMFLNWGFIGDSLSSGSINTEEDYDETFRTKLYDYSWGQYLCRLCGTQGYNFSRGGWSAKNWLEASGSHAGRGWAGAKANPKDVYAIAFGVNDRVQYSAGDADTDIGSYDATTDTDTNAATFAGYYAGIIQRIQSIQPKAKIFVITLPQGDAGDQGEFADFNVVIRAMATKFSNVYIVDLWNYAPTFSGGWNTRYRHVYHLTAQGYLWFAWCFAEYVDWIVRSNWADFKDVELIGSEYALEIR